MTKLFFSYVELQKTVNISLNNGLANVGSAISLANCSPLSEYGGTNVIDILKNSQNALNYSIQWINDSNKNIDNALLCIDNNLSIIKKQQLKDRNLIVK